jgi:hypothetical protein
LKTRLQKRPASTNREVASVFLKASIRATGESGHFNSLTDDIIDTIMEHASNAHHDASGNSMMYWHRLWSSKPHDNAFGFRRTGFEFWIHHLAENWPEEVMRMG